MANIERARASDGLNKASKLNTLKPETMLAGYWETVGTNCETWADEVSASKFWKDANTALDQWKKEYRRNHNSELIAGGLPKFVGKSADRIKEKTLSKIATSKDQDEKKIRELFDSIATVPRLEDLVRARVKCEFLDGVPFLAQKLEALALSLGLEASISPRGNLNGYFAQHLLFKTPVHYWLNKSSTSYILTCEIQIATSLGTHVWDNSHGIYESSRIQKERPEDWQWNPKDPRFLSRQLGHMIHLADGLFCMLRDSSKSSRKDSENT